jgi:hypothetical protein
LEATQEALNLKKNYWSLRRNWSVEKFGAQVEQVVEHRSSSCTPFIFEFDCYPEAKILSKAEIQAVYKRFKNWQMVADEVGASQAFVRQNSSAQQKKI